MHKMKTIIFFVKTDKFNLKNYQEKIFNNHKPKNWSIKKINDNLFNCYLMLNNSNEEIQFETTFQELSLPKAQILIDNAKKIVNLSFNLSKGLNISEPMDVDIENKQKLVDLILLKINNYFSYYFNEHSDIFELVAFIEYSLLQNHILLNGNKRFAFSFMVIFLRALGFYLKWISYNHKDEKRFEQIIIGWIGLMNQKICSEQEIINKIRKTIEEQSIIQINF